MRDAGRNSIQYSQCSPVKAQRVPRKPDIAFYFHTWEVKSEYKNIPNAIFWGYDCSLIPLQFDFSSDYINTERQINKILKW